ncbi:unnamed protein product [Absidia cylindrospora]
MKPTTTGELLLLEQFSKGSISTNHTDVGAMVNLMQFFWAVKFYSEQAVVGIKTLMLSHGRRSITGNYHDLPPLVSYLRPTFIKPKKNETLAGFSELDPSSML